jgi:hypothetical protein
MLCFIASSAVSASDESAPSKKAKVAPQALVVARVNDSASAIYSIHKYALNVFQLPYCWSGYIPNPRLARLRSSCQSATLSHESQSTVSILSNQLASQNAAQGVAGGSEKLCNRPNLNHILGRLTSLIATNGTSLVTNLFTASYLATSCESEPVCVLNGNMVAVSEAKGIGASYYDCYVSPWMHFISSIQCSYDQR